MSAVLMAGMPAVWAGLSLSSTNPKKPPENEALIPYLIKVDKLDRLHPPFPLYPVRDHTVLHPESLSQAEYRQYWKALEILKPHLNQLNAMFNQAEERDGSTTISVQQLSARLTSFLLHYDAVFKRLPPNLEQLTSYQAMESFQAQAKDVLYTLKVRGEATIHYRPMFEDVNEEDLVLNRLLVQIRNNLNTLDEYQRMHQAVTHGFYESDK
jgi:hypothetical protein